MTGSRRWPFHATIVVLYIFLLAPIFIVLPMSFSNDTFLQFPPSSWGTTWYYKLFQDPQLMQGFWTSLSLALTVTALSLLASVPAALALTRHEFRGREFLLNLFTAPLLLPSIVLGLAMLLVYVQIGLLGTYTGLVIAHLIVTTPYAIRIIATSFGSIPPALEEAAATLGATPIGVFMRITLPLMMPGLVASAALCFLVSFDEVVLSLFVTGPNATTLPVVLFNYAQTHADPMIAAVSTLLILVTFLLIALIERSIGLSKAIGKG